MGHEKEILHWKYNDYSKICILAPAFIWLISDADESTQHTIYQLQTFDRFIPL